MKKSLLKVIAPLAAASMLLAACGSDDSTGADGEIKKLVAGTEATFAPFEYMDDSGKIIGIDSEIVDAIAEETGIEIEMKHVGWDPMLEQVKNGEIEMGASGITINDKRKKVYDFTEPYYEANLVMVVKEGSDVKSLADLKGKKVSVQINTTGHEAAKKALGETSQDIAAFENMPVAIMEVINGSTAAAIGDNAVVYEYLKNNPDAKLTVIEDTAFEKEYYGLMVKKGNKEVLDILNEGLKAIKENGKLDEIVKKYTGVTQELE
ncbi:basic amino acid ABC transporter substrate-binding protein [Lysinibacillus odysseyi]|uniref:Amino acid ABC transporter substrate-binding protein n=1 Tax=Lysinibacillus odysseyi 34hs-1 = NBRC 100172 TaxID=1220589 RepID=A0A0A3IDJ0_9BACI|nr:basic amino acid ABC transporter substrate-binding protein [Lysinibacillus odysseyi]KGR82816.1 amino acid ABC transporter substrate-binding protein [Lysinibacillus odysseyi 34hs-1 = NBRC 100172]